MKKTLIILLLVMSFNMNAQRPRITLFEDKSKIVASSLFLGTGLLDVYRYDPIGKTKFEVGVRRAWQIFSIGISIRIMFN
jgi:hypothetical protein